VLPCTSQQRRRGHHTPTHTHQERDAAEAQLEERPHQRELVLCAVSQRYACEALRRTDSPGVQNSAGFLGLVGFARGAFSSSVVSCLAVRCAGWT
jgi:hypothetical protein